MHIDFVIQSSPDKQSFFRLCLRTPEPDRPTDRPGIQRSNTATQIEAGTANQLTNQPINQYLQSRSYLLGLSNKLPFLRTTIQHYSHQRLCKAALLTNPHHHPSSPWHSS